MPDHSVKRIGEVDISNVLDDLYRSESRRILSTLIRLPGDVDVGEDALQFDSGDAEVFPPLG